MASTLIPQRLKLHKKVTLLLAAAVGLIASCSREETPRQTPTSQTKGAEAGKGPRLTREDIINQIRQQGHDPAEYDIDAALVELQKPPSSEVAPEQKAKYWIRVKNGKSEESFYSQAEPKFINGGYRFKDIVLKREVLVSGNVIIINIDSK